MPQVHHSDVIGSLLRPRYLTQARDAYAAGQLTTPEFKRIEDRAVDQAIAMQEGIGLDVITDGEFRRFSFLDQVVGEIDGVEPIEGAPIHFKNADDGLGVAQPVHRDRQDQPEAEDHPGGVRLQQGPGDEARSRSPSRPRCCSTRPGRLSGPRPPTRTPTSCSRTPPRSSRPRSRPWPRSAAPTSRSTPPTSARIVDPENRELRESLGMPTERTLTEGLDIFNSVGGHPRGDVRRARLQGQQHEPVDRLGRLRLHRRGHVRPADQLRRVPARVRRRALRFVRAARQGARRQADHPRPGVEQDHHA